MSDGAEKPAEEGRKAKRGRWGWFTNARLGVILAAVGVLIAALGLLVTALTVPEFRGWLGLGPTPAPTATVTPAPTPSVTPSPSPTPPGEMIGEGAWLCPDSTDGAAYVGHLETKKFHELYCQYGRKISPANRVCFDSRAAAFRLEYEPCNYCTP